jgi:hypothetical protein
VAPTGFASLSVGHGGATAARISILASCVPVPAGGFDRRVFGAPRYDGIIGSHAESAVIAIFGLAPMKLKLINPNLPLIWPV